MIDKLIAEYEDYKQRNVPYGWIKEKQLDIAIALLENCGLTDAETREKALKIIKETT